MSWKLLILVVASCVVVFRAPASSQALPQEMGPRLTGALEEIEALLRRWGPESGPGCAYTASIGGHALFTRTYGMADLEHDARLTTQSVFNVGSVAKQFTAAATLLLVQDGKLRLEDDIRKYLPEMPDYGAPITIRHLLNHTSGLRDWMSVEQLAGHAQPRRYYNNSDVLEIAARQRGLNFAPGQRWSYSNTGYNLLAVIVSRVSGSSLAEFTRERLFKPLGMNSTQWVDDSRRIVKNRAVGYQKADRQKVGSDYLKPVPMGVGDQYGPGGLLTNMGDLLTWSYALNSGRLGPFITTELQRKTVLNDGRAVEYGAGLFLTKYQGQDVLWHDGDLAGYHSDLERFPRLGLSVAVLCNSEEARPRQISRIIADAFLPSPVSQRGTAKGVVVRLAPEQAARLAGVFIVEETGFPVVITVERGQLTVDGEALEAISETRFRGRWGEMVFKTPDLVERNMETEVGGLQTLRRINSTLPSGSQLLEFIGTFTSEEAQGSFDIFVEKGALAMKRTGGRGSPQPLKPVAQDLFEIVGLPLHFNRSADGKVNSFDFTDERVRALRFYRSAGDPAKR